MSTAKRNELKLLSQSRLRCIVLDTDGTYWMYGADYGLALQQSEVQFGQAFADFKGLVLNFLHKETDLPAKVQSGVVTSLGLI
jgi:predicted enzyme involved in methoxymalonyl-ACP biosynthesis